MSDWPRDCLCAVDTVQVQHGYDKELVYIEVGTPPRELTLFLASLATMPCLRATVARLTIVYVTLESLVATGRSDCRTSTGSLVLASNANKDEDADLVSVRQAH